MLYGFLVPATGSFAVFFRTFSRLGKEMLQIIQRYCVWTINWKGPTKKYHTL